MARDTSRSFSLPDSVLGLGPDESAYIIEGDFDPTVGAGQPAPIGSLFLRTDVPGNYLKDTSPDTGWTLQGTGSASFVNRQQLVFVGKHGSTSPASNGRVPDDPWNTFTNAITYVNTLTPSSINRFTILCQDSGIYSESFLIPAYVSVEGVDTTINGTVVISDDCELTIREIVAATNNPAVFKVAGSSSARVIAEIIRASGTGDAVTTQTGETGVLFVNARQIYTENGGGVVDNSTAPTGHIHVDIEDIYITGTGSGIDRASSNGFIVGRVSHILEIGGGIGVGNAINIDSGRVDLVMGFLNTTTSYRVAGPGTLKLAVGEITGNTIQTSGAATVDVMESDALRWITVDDTDSPYTPRRIGFVAFDTTNGPVTLSLPTPPSGGDNVSFQDARNTFGTNNLTIDAGVGYLIDDGGAGIQTVVLDISGTSGIFIYNSTISRWTFSRIQEEVAFSPANLIYVTKNGDDTLGDGSFSNPFLTIKRGIQEAQTRVATSPVPTTVKILDGVYNEINPINLTFANSEYVQIQGEQEFAVIVQPNVDTQPLFSLTSSVTNNGPSLNRITIDASNLPTFKTNNQTGIVITGPGRFVVDKVNIMNCGIGIDSGNGVSVNQESVFDFATISNCTTGINAKGLGLQACQVAFFRDNNVGIRASNSVRIEIGNYATQGADIGSPAFGVGFEMNDTSILLATSGTITNHVLGLEGNDSSESTLLTTSFVQNTTDFNQVNTTTNIRIQGTLSKTNHLIADGSNVSLNYIDNDTGDFIVGNADSTGNPGLEFRVRDFDGRVFIGDNATNQNAPTNTVGGSRTVNLIDTNGNFRVWRWEATPGLHPAFEWVKGVNTFIADDEGDAPITTITGGANGVITINVSGTDYNDPLDPIPGSDRTTMTTRVFYPGAEIRVNGTPSDNGNYIVQSSVYNSGPQTIDVTVTTAMTGGGTGICVFGGGAGRPDGVSTYVNDPSAAINAGVGDIHWDMLLRETDSFVIRRRTGGSGKEHFRFFRDHAEFLFGPNYSGQSPLAMFVEGVDNAAVNYLTIRNAITNNGPEIISTGADANVNIELIPKGTGTAVVPVGYEANIINNSLITKQYFDDNSVSSDLSSVTVGITSSIAIPITWTNVLWTVTHVENNTAIIEHDNTNIDRILIKETGLYLIAYSMSFDADVGEEIIEGRVLVDDTIVVPGSARLASEDDEINDLSNCFTANLTAGTYLTFQNQASGAGNVFHISSNFSITRARGVKGEKGDPGSGSTVAVQEEGTSLGTLFDTLNFVGRGTATNAGGGVVTVTIPRQTYFHGHNDVVTQTFTTTLTTINFATNIRQDADYTANTVGGGTEVTVNKTGTNWFKVTYDISLASPTGSSRSSSRAELQINGTTVPGSDSYGYHRITTNSQDTLTATLIIQLAQNDVIRIQAVRIAGTDALTTIANGCRLTLEWIDSP